MLIRAFGKLGFKQATPLLIDEFSRLQNSGKISPSMTQAIVGSLSRIRDPASKAVVSEFLERFDSYVEQEVKRSLFPDSADTMTEYYHYRWLDIHRKSIALAGELGATEAVPTLISYLDRREVRRTSAYALVRIGDPRAVEPLISVIEMTRCDVTAEQLEALKNNPQFSEIEPLLSCVRDYEPVCVEQMLVDIAEQKARERYARMNPGPPCKVPEDMMLQAPRRDSSFFPHAMTPSSDAEARYQRVFAEAHASIERRRVIGTSDLDSGIAQIVAEGPDIVPYLLKLARVDRTRCGWPYWALLCGSLRELDTDESKNILQEIASDQQAARYVREYAGLALKGKIKAPKER